MLIASSPADETLRRAATLVRAALDEYNGRVEPELRVSVEPGAALYGTDGGLDSAGLLDLLAILETRIEAELGRPVTIGEDATTGEGGGFRSVDSVVAMVARLFEASAP
jgi:predicted NBD/HSP70 family sugar kinase